MEPALDVAVTVLVCIWVGVGRVGEVLHSPNFMLQLGILLSLAPTEGREVRRDFKENIWKK